MRARGLLHLERRAELREPGRATDRIDFITRLLIGKRADGKRGASCYRSVLGVKNAGAGAIDARGAADDGLLDLLSCCGRGHQGHDRNAAEKDRLKLHLIAPC